MELKEGMYARTKNGIRKCIIADYDGTYQFNEEIYDEDGNGLAWLEEDEGELERYILKASYVLGEVLEVGDFIDIHYIYEIKGTTIITYSGWFIDFEDIEDCVEKIVTKEPINIAFNKTGNTRQNKR